MTAKTVVVSGEFYSQRKLNHFHAEKGGLSTNHFSIFTLVHQNFFKKPTNTKVAFKQKGGWLTVHQDYEHIMQYVMILRCHFWLNLFRSFFLNEELSDWERCIATAVQNFHETQVGALYHTSSMAKLFTLSTRYHHSFGWQSMWSQFFLVNWQSETTRGGTRRWL